MIIDSFSLGELESEQIVFDREEKSIAKVLYYDFGMIFRAQERYGPSLTDIVIPYGSPVYRMSSRPLSALMGFQVYPMVDPLHDQVLVGTGILEVFSELSDAKIGFQSATMFAGQWNPADGQLLSRDQFIINDCVHLKAVWCKAILLDLAFVQDGDLLYASTIQKVMACFEERPWMKILSEGSADNKNQRALHVYAIVWPGKLHQFPNSYPWELIHGLYRRKFLNTWQDLAFADVNTGVNLMAGMNILGEYSWYDLCNIYPAKNTFYSLSCKSFNSCKNQLQQIYSVGSEPEFIAMLQKYTYY